MDKRPVASGQSLALLDLGAWPCYFQPAMKIAALLPHVELFGGVRRYLELGNEFWKRGHAFVLFHPGGEKPGWLEFRGETRPLEVVERESFDVGLCSEYSILDAFTRLRARAKYFYFVLEGNRREREVVRLPFRFLGKSEGICRRIERRYDVPCFRAAGGVNPAIFHPVEREGPSPEKEFRVLCYGRLYRKRKGIQRVIKAAGGLAGIFPGLRLIFFDTLVGRDRKDPRLMLKTSVPYEFHLGLPQSRMAWLYSQADLFVSAERRAGWSNTAAEAMACRLPVICTPSGTQDFAEPGKTAMVVPHSRVRLLRRAMKRLILDPGLRKVLAEEGYKEIQKFTWEALAARLERHFVEGRN